MTCSANNRESGFTLLELLVSLALTALLMAAVPATLKFAQRGVAAAAELDSRARVGSALMFLEQRLSEATASYDRGDDGRLRILFNGEPNSLAFVAPLTFKTEDSGLARFTYALGSDSQGRSGLLLTWLPWRPAPAEGQSTAAEEPRSRLVITPANNFGLRYFGAASADDQPGWSETWQRNDALPDLVEFRVATHGGVKVSVVNLRLKAQ